MPYDVFISHSTKDKIVADAVVAHLERHGIRCWCAPRDIMPGESWASAIVGAIAHCRAVVVVFSRHANESDHIRREVERAVGHGVPIVPMRIEDVMPQGDLEYFLSSSHWMDAISAPIERHLDVLAEQLHVLLKSHAPGATGTDAAQAPPLPVGDGGGMLRRQWLSRPRLAGMLVIVIVAAVAIALSAMNWGRRPKPAAITHVSLPAPTSSGASQPRAEEASSSAKSSTPKSTPLTPSTSLKKDIDVTGEPAPSSQSTPVAKAASGDLAADALAWHRASLIHWDNAFFFDHARARYPVWRRAADAGDPVGEFFVGCCYAQGMGVAEDQERANQWLTKAINAGNTDAMNMMGERRALGLGIAQDGFAAYSLGKRAADAGNVPAMYGVGLGLSVQSDATAQTESHRLLQKAADAGSLDARLALLVLAGLPSNEFNARVKPLADGGQPIAMLMIALSRNEDSSVADLTRRALAGMGQPLEISHLMDPLPGAFPGSPTMIKLAWARLHELADAGSGPAARMIVDLNHRGFHE